MKISKPAGFLLMAMGLYSISFAQKMSSEKTVNVGGAPMYASKNIIQNAMNSKDHTTLFPADLIAKNWLQESKRGMVPQN